MESKLVGFCYCVSHLVAKLLGRGLFTWLQLSKDGLLHGKPGIVRCCHKVCGSVHSCAFVIHVVRALLLRATFEIWRILILSSLNAALSPVKCPLHYGSSIFKATELLLLRRPLCTA